MKQTIAVTPEIHPLSVDQVKQIANEAGEYRMHPLKAARLILTQRIETPGGMQPRYLSIGSVIQRERFEPTVPLTCFSLTDDNPSVSCRPILPTERGGGRLLVRASGNPAAGLWNTISGFNMHLERVLHGGFGVNDRYDLGVAAWRQQGKDDPGTLLAHVNVLRNMRANPNVIVGFEHIIENDGSFRRTNVPRDLPDLYASPAKNGHKTIASYPVTAGALLTLPNIVAYDYSVR
ncbi:MAG TPA: hypothetical protein VJ836_06485 [Candidatus Saccharimonadales bacterium]|nr:hypothetical protein [Candidatus Saccharimonadales bacterium]